MWNSLRTRLTIIFVGLAIGPLIVVGGLLSQRNFVVAQDQAAELQRQVAQRVSAELDAFIGEVENNLYHLGDDMRNLGQPDRAQQMSFLLGALNTGQYRDVYESLSLLDVDGYETIRLSRNEIVSGAELQDRAGEEEFNQPKASKATYFSPVWFNATTGEAFMTIAIPLYPLRSVVLSGVLVADFRLKALRNLIDNLKLSADQTIYIEDLEGRVVVHNDPSIVSSKVSFVLQADSGRTQGLSAADVLYATDRIRHSNVDLVVVAERSAASALELAQNSLYVSLIVMLFALIGAVGLVVLTVRQVVSPVENLSVVARAIQKGDLSIRSDIRSHDEIGQLAQSFNEMAEAIQKRESNLLEQADALRIATAKAKEAARVKGEFLANISHELRTPLNAIIGFSDMLLMGMSGELNPKQKHKMERLRENGTRLLTLINNVLDITRIEARRIEINAKLFSPRALADRLTEQMNVLAEQKKLTLKTTIDPDLPELLIGDEQRVEQVVVNLLSNAFKFTDAGAVTLELMVNPNQNTWDICVSDTGIGIPPHALSLIFEEFRQVDGSLARAYKGSGLGLAITRNLVRMMDGQIAVDSEMGQGSKFTVTFPLTTRENFQMEPLEKVSA